MRSRLISLIVSATGATNIAAPVKLAAATNRSISSGVTNGRTPSCTATISALPIAFKPQSTDCARVAPVRLVLELPLADNELLASVAARL